MKQILLINIFCGIFYLNAQESAISFYEKLGFDSIGPRFYEVGIAHQKMIFPIVG